MFLFHRLSLSQELKKAPTPPAQQPPPPVTPAPPQPLVSSRQCSNPYQLWIWKHCLRTFRLAFLLWRSANTTCFLSPADAQKRKSKWDSAIPVTLAQPTIITTTAMLPAVVSVTTTAAGTKTTVISAVGTILKKAKQWRGQSQDGVSGGWKSRAVIIISIMYSRGNREGSNQLVASFQTQARGLFRTRLDGRRLCLHSSGVRAVCCYRCGRHGQISRRRDTAVFKHVGNMKTRSEKAHRDAW